MFFCSHVFPKTMFTRHKYLSEVVIMYRLVSILPLFRLCKRFHVKCNGFHEFFIRPIIFPNIFANAQDKIRFDSHKNNNKM